MTAGPAVHHGAPPPAPVLPRPATGVRYRNSWDADTSPRRSQDGVGGARRALELVQLWSAVASRLMPAVSGYRDEVEALRADVEAAIPYTGIDTNSCSAP